MAKKYIDAEKLIANLERQNVDKKVIEPVIRIINSLRQEQDLIVINKKTWEAQEQFRKNKDFGKPLQREQTCDTCTNDKGCVTCKDGELWEGKEQPSEDLEEEIEMEWDSFNKHLAEYGGESEEVVWLNWNSFVDIARHFYELGQQAKKEK